MRKFAGVASLWAAIWLVLLAAQIVLLWLVDGGWTQSTFSPSTRIWFASSEAVMAAFAALLVALVGTALQAPFAKLAQRRPVVAQLPVALLLFVVNAFYFSSWALYAVMNEFVGPDAVRMVVANGLQLLEHAQVMAATEVVAVPLAAVVATVCMLVVRESFFRWPAVRQQKLLTALVLFVGAAAVFNALHGAALRDRLPGPGQLLTPEDAEFFRTSQRSGPFIFLRDNAINALARRSLEPQGAPDGYVMHEIVSNEEYHDQVGAGFDHYNVVILVIESLRPDAFEVFGGDERVMPTLEAVAQESARFHDVYAASSHSNYADIAIISSQYPLRENTTHYYPADPPYPRVMLHDLLAPSGYRSALFSSQNEDWGGMINFFDTGNFEAIVHAGNFDGTLREEHVLYRNEAFKKYRREMNLNPRGGKVDDAVTIDMAREWLKQIEPDQPFYLHLNMQSSHLPYYVPPGFKRRFFTEKGEGLDDLRAGRLIELTSSQMYAAYLDSLAYVDEQISRLVEDLRRSGRWDRTIFVVTGDTATSFNALIDHDGDGSLTKIIGNGGALIEDVVKVPLVIRAPGLESQDIHVRVQHIDILPGVLHLLGLPPHPGLQGMNPFHGSVGMRPVFLAAQTPAAHQYAAIIGDLKLIHDLNLRRFIYEYVGSDAPDRDTAYRIAPILEAELSSWVKAQLGYYARPELFDSVYPPRRTVQERRGQHAPN